MSTRSIESHLQSVTAPLLFAKGACSSCKVGQFALAVLALIGSAALITCGVLYSFQALWITGIVTAAAALVFSCLRCCCCICCEDEGNEEILPQPNYSQQPAKYKSEIPDTSTQKSQEVLIFEDPQCTAAQLSKMSEKEIAISYGLEVINSCQHNSKTPLIDRYDRKILKAVLKNWEIIPDNCDTKIAFVCSHMISALIVLPREDQTAKLLEVIHLLREINFEFRDLFENFLLHVVPDNHDLLKIAFPVAYLQEACSFKEQFRREVCLSTIFSGFQLTLILVGALHHYLTYDERKIIYDFFSHHPTFNESEKVLAKALLRVD